MGILVFMLALSTGDVDLPLTLASEPPAQAQAQKGKELPWSVGPRLGVATAFDSDDAALVIGAQGRVRILPWLSGEASIDFQTSQTYDSNDIDVLIFPIQISALFYVPVPEDFPVKPYGLVGLNFNIIDVEYSGALSGKSDKTEVKGGAHFGFGADWAITPKMVLDADFRFIFIGGSANGNDFDYFQFTVGLNFLLN